MGFSYQPGDSQPLHRARLVLGDTDSTAQEGSRLEDEEILDLISQHGYRTGVYHAFLALASRFLRKAEGSTGPQRIVPLSRSQELRASAERWLRSGHAAPFGGGLTVSEHAAAAADTDKSQPAFTRGMLDNKS